MNIPDYIPQASAEDCLRWLVQYGLGSGGTPAGSSSAFGTTTPTLETGTTALTGLRCGAIQMLADTVFSTLTGMAGDAIAGGTFPKGLTIYGQFTAITLTSGSIVFYQ